MLLPRTFVAGVVLVGSLNTVDAWAAAGLTAEVVAGVDQRRKFDSETRASFSHLRLLPPSNEPFTIHATVPLAWLDQPVPDSSNLTAVAGRTREQGKPLLRSLREAGLLGDSVGPLQATGVLAGVLRNAEIEGSGPHPADKRIFDLWEVLADPRQADTLDSAFSVLVLAGTLGHNAWLMVYSSSDARVFGIAVPESSGAVGDKEPPWAHRVTSGDRSWWLVPVHPQASPDSSAKPEPFRLEQVLASDWVERLEKAPPRSIPKIVRQPNKLRIEELCARAESRGFRCVSPGIPEETWYALAAAITILLVIIGIRTYVSARNRRRLVEMQMRERKGF